MLRNHVSDPCERDSSHCQSALQTSSRNHPPPNQISFLYFIPSSILHLMLLSFSMLLLSNYGLYVWPNVYTTYASVSAWHSVCCNQCITHLVLYTPMLKRKSCDMRKGAHICICHCTSLSYCTISLACLGDLTLLVRGLSISGLPFSLVCTQRALATHGRRATHILDSMVMAAETLGTQGHTIRDHALLHPATGASVRPLLYRKSEGAGGKISQSLREIGH